MEVTAKRARLAPRKLKLLDLDDDALIMIINRLDHKSKLQMMATCKRFEGLIGHTHQFYKNFKFCYDQEKSQESEDLQQIRRCFQIVEISGKAARSLEKKPLRQSVLDFLKTIGADILKIKLHNLAFNKAVFLEVMKALTNVRELEISEIKFTETDPDENFVCFELKHLTKLDISHSTGLRFCFDFVPASLKSLKINNWWYRELLVPDLLGKQKHLEELSLDRCTNEEFKFDPENCHIEKLTIDYPRLLNDRAFKQLSEFMKIQESVVELELAIGYNELMEANPNYAGILTHLLNLKSLKKITIDCGNAVDFLEVFSRLKICNPVVNTLTIKSPHHLDADLSSFPKLFPNVTDLKITWPLVSFLGFPFNYFFVDLEPIHSMKMIRKLEIEYASNEMLAQLALKELREFHLTNIVSTEDDIVYENGFVDLSESWTTFVNNNCQLEVLHMPKCEMSVEQLQITLESLPLLKSLEFAVYGCDFVPDDPEFSEDDFKKEQAEEAARLIGEKYDRLEHLKLDVYDDLISATILNYLEEHCPDVKLNK
jgi:hypothetical protein